VSGRSFLIQWRDALTASALSPPARHVGHVLTTHMNRQGGSCFPSTRLLAAETGYAPNTVAAAINELESEGFVRVARGGGRRPNQYQAVLPNVSAGETKPRPDSSAYVSVGASLMSQPLRGSASPTATEDAHRGRSGGRSTDVSPNGDTSARARQNGRESVCPECEVGGGRHIEGCTAAAITDAVEGSTL
jgi:Helix-turn-helix domain